MRVWVICRFSTLIYSMSNIIRSINFVKISYILIDIYAIKPIRSVKIVY